MTPALRQPRLAEQELEVNLGLQSEALSQKTKIEKERGKNERRGTVTSLLHDLSVPLSSKS